MSPPEEFCLSRTIQMFALLLLLLLLLLLYTEKMCVNKKAKKQQRSDIDANTQTHTQYHAVV